MFANIGFAISDLVISSFLFSNSLLPVFICINIYPPVIIIIKT